MQDQQERVVEDRLAARTSGADRVTCDVHAHRHARWGEPVRVGHLGAARGEPREVLQATVGDRPTEEERALPEHRMPPSQLDQRPRECEQLGFGVDE